MRMEGIDADTVVGIAILPGTRHIGIGDRQHLKDTLFGLGTPVDHHLQIAEVTHAEATLTTEREDGNHRTCRLPRVNGEIGLRQFIDHHLAEFDFGQINRTVHTVLPEWCHIHLLIEGHELKLKGLRQLVGIETDDPFVGLVFCHVQGALGLPVP